MDWSHFGRFIGTSTYFDVEERTILSEFIGMRLKLMDSTRTVLSPVWKREKNPIERIDTWQGFAPTGTYESTHVEDGATIHVANAFQTTYPLSIVSIHDDGDHVGTTVCATFVLQGQEFERGYISFLDILPLIQRRYKMEYDLLNLQIDRHSKLTIRVNTGTASGIMDQEEDVFVGIRKERRGPTVGFSFAGQLYQRTDMVEFSRRELQIDLLKLPPGIFEVQIYNQSYDRTFGTPVRFHSRQHTDVGDYDRPEVEVDGITIQPITSVEFEITVTVDTLSIVRIVDDAGREVVRRTGNGEIRFNNIDDGILAAGYYRVEHMNYSTRAIEKTVHDVFLPYGKH